MFSWLTRLLRPASEVLLLSDPAFGRISFFPSVPHGRVGIWQMEDRWVGKGDSVTISCNSIPGTTEGPYPQSRAFLLSKKQDELAIWTLCAPTLEAVKARWPALQSAQPLATTFRLASLGLDEPIVDLPRWSVGFESTGKFWVYTNITILGDTVEGYSCDT